MTWAAPPSVPPTLASGAGLDISTPASGIVWVAGISGVWRSTDSGSTWTTYANIPARYAWTSVQATSATDAYVASDSGDILRTTDGGATWTSISPSCGGCYIWKFRAADASNFYALMGSATVRTTNGGTSWTTVLDTSPHKGFELFVQDASTAWIVGDRGVMSRTTDGVTWTNPTTSPTLGSIRDLAVNGATLYAAGAGGAILVSTDSGATWVNRRSATWSPALHGIDATRNLVVVSGDAGRIRSSTDGGTTWTTRTSGTSQHLLDVASVGSVASLAVGTSGRIVRSTDGAVTWTTVPSGVSVTLRSVDMDSDGYAVAVGDGGAILRSWDFGATWSDVSQPGGDLFGVTVDDPATTYAVGAGGRMLTSSDQSRTWVARTSGTSRTLVSIDARIGGQAWTVGDVRLRTTTNGGATWSTTSAAPPLGYAYLSVDLLDDLTARIVSVDGIMETRDGGSTWASFTEYQDYRAGVTVDANETLIVADGDYVKVTPRPSVIANYGGGATWGAGAAQSVFGTCLRAVGGAALPATWTVDGNAACTASDADPWQALPNAPAVIASTTGAAGWVDVAFGFRPASSTPPGIYRATLLIEVVAP